MDTFLILSVLSVGFYVFVLAGLYLDGRKSRKALAVAGQSEFSTGADMHLTGLHTGVSAITSSSHLASKVSWHPVTRIRWQAARHVSNVSPQEPLIAAASVNFNKPSKRG